MKSIVVWAAGASLATLSQAAMAKDVVVQMRNAGPGGTMVFVPMKVEAKPGDVIRFVPTDLGHNAQTIDGMLPDGVAGVTGKLNHELDLTVTRPGYYGVECRPHLGLGMVALVKVGRGTAPNAAAARAVKLPPLAQRRMQALLAEP